MTVSTLIFGLASYSSSAIVFLSVSAIARLIQSIGDAFVCVSVGTIICFEYPDKQQEYMSYYSMTAGIGLCLGPMCGAIVFNLVGYTGTFYFFFVVLLAATIVS